MQQEKSIAERLAEWEKLAANIHIPTATEMEAKQKDVWPYEEELEIRWRRENGVKLYTVCCGKCGDKHMRRWGGGNGLRCKTCNFFHSYTAFAKLAKRAESLSRFNDGKIEQIIQPKKPDTRVKILIDSKTGKVIPLGKVSGVQLQEKIQQYLKTR